MASWFHTPTVKEQVKDTKRTVDRGQRQVQRDIGELDREEARVTLQLKSAAKAGRDAEVKILAKQVVQIRKQKERMTNMKAQMGTIKTNAAMMGATHTMTEAMAKTSKTTAAMNKQMNPAKMQSQIREMGLQMQTADLSSEMMDDAMDAMFDDDEGVSDEIVRETLEKIGVDTAAALGSAPSKPIKSSQEATMEDDEVEETMRRLLKS
jgi:division protein CdvB (Snf7/Vps24/ESCRT-III family)